MSSVVISGDSSGTVSLTVPAVAGTNTATLPAATGTVMVSGNMPAFSAYQSTLQSVPNATFTKVQLQTELYDTNNYFDSTTNYRFQPLIAGYYQLSANIQYASAVAGITVLTIFKNGTEFQRGPLFNSLATYGGCVSSLVYLNGSTDYVELYCYQAGGTSLNTGALSSTTFLNGVLARTA